MSPSSKKRSKSEAEEFSSSDEPEESSSLLGRSDHVEVGLGDTVLLSIADSLFGSNTNTEADSMMVARVEKVWREGNRKKFRARWFLSKQHVEHLFHQSLNLHQSIQEMSDRITAHDLVLTNHFDDNDIETVHKKVLVVYREPYSDESLPSLPDDTYICRYAMAFATNGLNTDGVQITPFAGEEDDWTEILMNDNPQAKRQCSRTTSSLSHEETASSDSDDGSASQGRYRAVAEGEGTILRRDTRVGSQYQTQVPSLLHNRLQEVASRKPTLVWKSEGIDQERLNWFLEQVSEVLYPYLRDNRLTQEEPYSPLSCDKMEAIVNATNSNTMPTLSSLCTFSSLSKSSKSMLREFDADAVLVFLHENNYDTSETLAAIKKSPQTFVTLWSPKEREIFNYRFRKHAGSMRMAWKGVSSSKDFHDIVDYHYRFKIPDQFRRLQTKKREEAVRVMEGIEARRSLNSTVPLDPERYSSTDVEDNQEADQSPTIAERKWHSTGIADVTGAVRERRSNAKEVLLDIEEKLGKDKLERLVGVIRNFHQIPACEITSEIKNVFLDDTELQDRFTDFLPRDLRC